MESINRLREYVENASHMSISLMARATLLGMVRDIEQEVGNMVPLPVDAEGEPIHVGDVMEVINGGLQAEACYMQIGPSGNWSVGLTKQCRWYDTESLRHHREPTVEDVLREFAYGLGVPVADSYIAASAAKLRLRGDAE